MRAPELKFCGLTRAEDAAVAAELEAGFAGAIFAHGPRLLDAPRANAMFDGLGDARVRRVGVFGARPVKEVLRIADAARLDVLQLHDGGTPDRLLMLRQRFPGTIWVVARVRGTALESIDPEVAAAADAVVLDTVIGDRSGGTGVPFDWAATAAAVRSLSARTRVVLAGGLRATNVADAVRTLAPWAVDVSSGVESAPGIKDHGQMRAFAAAARLREG